MSTDKFSEYFQGDEERIKELSEYVHMNFHLIATKMMSEMRRKLNITPCLQNSDGYMSLMVSIYGRMFNELIYSLAGLCQSCKLNLDQIVPPATIEIFNCLLKGENYLKGNIRDDITATQTEKNEYYLRHIDFLRKIEESLPEYHFKTQKKG